MPKFLSGSYTLNATTSIATIVLGYTLSSTNTVTIVAQTDSANGQYIGTLTVTNAQVNGTAGETGRWFAYVP